MTVQETFGLQCPKCKSGQLEVEIKVWATLYSDGSDVEGQDHEWDDNSPVNCLECKHTGTIKTFTIPSEDR